MKEWWNNYKKKLEPRADEVRHLKIDTLETFGTESFETYFAFFKRLFAQGRSIESVVREYVPRLLPGIWKAALHPGISLGYALQIQNVNAATYALAYWSYKWALFDESLKIDCAPVPPELTVSGSAPKTASSAEVAQMPKSLGDLFAKGKSSAEDKTSGKTQRGKEGDEVDEPLGFWNILQDMQEEAGESLVTDAPRGFSERLIRVRDNPTYHAALYHGFQRLQKYLNSEYPDSKSMLRWTNSAAFAVFRTTFCKEFFLLHVLTSLHAMRYLLSYIDDESERRKAVLYFNFVFLAIYLAQGAPNTDMRVQYDLSQSKVDDMEEDMMRWRKIHDKVLEYSDEHVIKLVHVAKWNFDTESDPYLRELFLDCAETIESNVALNGDGYIFRPAAID